MTIQEIHKFINLILDKEKSGMVTPGEIDQALDRASMETFKAMLPYYAVNQTYQDALSPFKSQYTFTNTTSAAGIVQLPADYQHFLSATSMVFDNATGNNTKLPVEIVNSDELAERAKSQLKPVTTNKPIAHWIGRGKFQLLPSIPAVGVCWYLKRPNAPHYVFSQAGRVITYDAANSVQLEWGELELNNVIFRALQFLGVNLSNEQMIQYTQLKIQEG